MLQLRTSDLFLSTPSARRATAHNVSYTVEGGISIHAFREEGDTAITNHPQGRTGFLSTPSARRATIADHSAYLAGAIFLSTPSARRATLMPLALVALASLFLSTPSARRATLHRSPGWRLRGRSLRVISIHALREEGDRTKRPPT